MMNPNKIVGYYEIVSILKWRAILLDSIYPLLIS